MKLLTVIKNGEFTGVQYEQDSDAIRAHHTSQGETLVFLDYRLTNMAMTLMCGKKQER